MTAASLFWEFIMQYLPVFITIAIIIVVIVVLNVIFFIFSKKNKKSTN